MTLETIPTAAAVIGSGSVVGAHRVDSAWSRKLLVSQTGRRYSQEELFESQRNLYESDLYRFATVTSIRHETPAGAVGAPGGAGQREQTEPGSRWAGLCNL